jgi:CBS domain-containing protein
MAQAIRDVMAQDPKTVSADDPIIRAAELMRDEDIGDVIVLDADGELCGIVTDRDITIRAVAEGQDPSSAKIEAVCSPEVATIGPDDDVESAARMMRERAVRRLPVVDNGRVVGAVSIGDLALELDPDSALADISAARGNE